MYSQDHKTSRPYREFYTPEERGLRGFHASHSTRIVPYSITRGRRSTKLFEDLVKLAKKVKTVIEGERALSDLSGGASASSASGGCARTVAGVVDQVACLLIFVDIS